MISEIWENILDLFFPPHCVNCGKIGTFLCPSCEQNILKIKAQTCPNCNKITQKGQYCERCKRKNHLNGVVSYGYFKDEALKNAIHDFKYQKYSALAPELAKLMVQALKKEQIKFDVISFVPITKKRRAWRGFNQAELLATELSEIFEKPIIRLAKTKETNTQVGLKRKDREKNLEGAFSFSGQKLNKASVLLVDDVITTGTTLNECAKVLKRNGAKSVYGAVLAKE